MDLVERRGGATQRHPWEKSRANFFKLVVRQAKPSEKPINVLDVGAGDGYLAGTLFADLPAGSRVVCFDPNYSPEDLAAYGREAPEGVSFTREPPVGRFDVLLLLDVIEHVPDDVAFLSQLTQRHLAPDGTVVVSVPAYQALFSKHDEALRHYRRYSPAQLRSLLQGQGLTIQRQGGLFHSLLVPRALTVARERLLRRLGKQPALPATADDWKHGPFLSGAVERVLALDNAITRATARIGFLPGLSVWAACCVDEPALGPAEVSREVRAPVPGGPPDLSADGGPPSAVKSGT